MSNPVTLAELDKALDALVMSEIIPYVAEDDITISKVSEKYNIEHKKAKNIIKKLVEDGKLESVGKRVARSNGRIVDAWKMKG